MVTIYKPLQISKTIAVKISQIAVSIYILSTPAYAQTNQFTGLQYDDELSESLTVEQPMDLESESELRNSLKTFHLEYSPVQLPTEINNQLSEPTNAEIDIEIQTTEHEPLELPKFTPFVPGAVEDKNGDLNNSACANKVYKGRAMVADISDQRARIYEPVNRNGTLVCTNVATFKITTGKNGSPTPIGEYYLGDFERVEVGNYTVDWMSFKNVKNQWWGIHQAPWQQIEFGTVPNSNGCIRFHTKLWTEKVRPLLFKFMFFKVQL